MAFEDHAGISLFYDKNTCDRQSTCNQTLLKFQIRLTEIKTGAFGHSTNHISRTQKPRKYLSYEADLLFQNAENFV